MKRHIVISLLIGKSESASIIIDKNGMRVEDKCDSCKYERDDYFYRNFISSCVDLDEWKHSWHTSVNKAMMKRTDERKKYRQIMLDKISQREDEIQMLKDGMQVLGRCPQF